MYLQWSLYLIPLRGTGLQRLVLALLCLQALDLCSLPPYACALA